MPVYKLMPPRIHTFSTKTGGKSAPRLNMCALTAAFGHPGVLVGKWLCVKGGFKLSFSGGLKMYDLGGLRTDRC